MDDDMPPLRLSARERKWLRQLYNVKAHLADMVTDYKSVPAMIRGRLGLLNELIDTEISTQVAESYEWYRMHDKLDAEDE